jgi:hypothetical protein
MILGNVGCLICVGYKKPFEISWVFREYQDEIKISFSIQLIIIASHSLHFGLRGEVMSQHRLLKELVFLTAIHNLLDISMNFSQPNIYISVVSQRSNLGN